MVKGDKQHENYYLLHRVGCFNSALVGIHFNMQHFVMLLVRIMMRHRIHRDLGSCQEIRETSSINKTCADC